MRRCELQGLYFQTKFFSNHSQLFSCWSTLRCYVKTLRKDQRIINWKRLDRISTCQLKCMWPQRLSPHIETSQPGLACIWNISSTDSNNRISFSDNQSWSLSRARFGLGCLVSHAHMCHFHSHTDTRPGRGHISNLNRLYGHRINCPWPYLNFKAMMLRPFFNRSGSPHPMVGRPCDQARPPGQLVTQAGDHCTLLHCWWPLPGSRHNNVHNTQSRVRERISILNVCALHFHGWSLNA